MNTSALQNIKTLSSLNDNDKFLFIDYNLMITDDLPSDYNIIQLEYGIYFTFQESLNSSVSNRNLINDINISIDKLYDNKFFLNKLETNERLSSLMDDVCVKIDIITEKYNKKNYCNNVLEELFNRSIVYCKSIVKYHQVTTMVESGSESDSECNSDNDDDFVKEDDLKQE